MAAPLIMQNGAPLFLEVGFCQRVRPMTGAMFVDERGHRFSGRQGPLARYAIAKHAYAVRAIWLAWRNSRLWRSQPFGSASRQSRSERQLGRQHQIPPSSPTCAAFSPHSRSCLISKPSPPSMMCVIPLAIQHCPHRAFPNRGRIYVHRSAHKGSAFAGVGGSGKPARSRSSNR